MSELMEDAQDFGWASAKGAHAVLLCRMEEGKVNWAKTEKIDRIRRAHAQKVVNNPSKKSTPELSGVPCKFFQSQKCPHKGDHHTAVQLYKHICSVCNTLGKRFPHALKDCRNSKKSTVDSKKRIRHCSNAVQSTQVKRQNHSQVTNGRDRKTRVISSNTWVTGESSNWRSDYHRFKGYTFAQVLKGKPKPLQAVTKNSGQIPTFSSQSVSSTQQPSKTIKVRCTSNPQPQVKKGSHLHTRGKSHQ